ncbi:unnamed protein product [Mucor hiemalis]
MYTEYLHFKSHLAASVFYNSNIEAPPDLDGIMVSFQPIILANGETIRYSQRELSFASLSQPPPPRQASLAFEPSPPQPQAFLSLVFEPPPPQPQASVVSEPPPPQPQAFFVDSWKNHVEQAIREFKGAEKFYEEELPGTVIGGGIALMILLYVLPLTLQ